MEFSGKNSRGILKKESSFGRILEAVGNHRKINVIAPTLSAKSLIVSLLACFGPVNKILAITKNDSDASTVAQDVSTFLHFFGKPSLKVVNYPERQLYLDGKIISDPIDRSPRLDALHMLAQNSSPFIIIGPASAFAQKTLPRNIFLSETIFIKPGMTIDLDELVRALIVKGYSREANVEAKGTFALRGGIIDIFSPACEFPARIDFAGDVVESIRTFDPETQLSDKREDIEGYDVIPAREILISGNNINLAKKSLRQLADKFDIPKRKRRPIFEALEEESLPHDLEFLFPAFYEKTGAVFDYLSPDQLVVGIDSLGLMHALTLNQRMEFESFESCIGKEELKFPPEDLYLDPHEFLNEVEKRSLLTINDFPLENISGETIELTVSEIDPLKMESEAARKKPLQYLTGLLKQLTIENSKTYFFTENENSLDRMEHSLKEAGIDLYIDRDSFVGSPNPGEASVTITGGKLSGCFSIPELKISFLDEELVFQKKGGAQALALEPSKFIARLGELSTGDYVVHQDHGIGKYGGLVNLQVAGTKGDFLLLVYDGDARLYLPVYRMNLIHKYVGKDSSRPSLNRLGSKSWDNMKSRAAKAVMEIALELLKLYATRKVISGFAFSKPDSAYDDFEALFPFKETADQIKALEDVFHDMENEKPMDRLICGDVGYGKTEVAIRGAYKAVMDGKQVAVLVPTTILAQQHYETFRGRFKNYPVEIDFLSRFKSKAAQKRGINNIREGKTDIVIGTHRLLSDDVKFKDLGLLVIDEEHRFGVNHKEKIKKYRSYVDVLALSATPIPRSLQLSLLGIRDLSVINTPPFDRKAVKTYIAKYDDSIIHNAIQKELAREGQIFFVHNRIETIDKIHEHLKKIVPNARIAVAHGRMREDRLEKVMIGFLKREYDILLSTAIIESGLDIPNANTMIINRADRLGLAQLYQLRGRVGRSKELAYTYLLLPDEELLTDDAQKRIRVLRNFTELGSGIKIALHDLEIRGAGNIFGASQSGHISAIGLEMYTKILEKTILKLKGESVEEEYEPELKVNIEAFIQDSYVEDVGERLGFYKMIAGAKSDNELNDISRELVDRFGKMPKRVGILLKLVSLKLAAKKLKIREILIDSKSIQFGLDESSKISNEKLVDALKGNKISYTREKRIKISLETDDPFARLELAKKMLQRLT